MTNTVTASMITARRMTILTVTIIINVALVASLELVTGEEEGSVIIINYNTSTYRIKFIRDQALKLV